MVSLRLENDDDVDISPAWLTAHAPWPWWGERRCLAGRGDPTPTEGHGGRLGTLVETDVKNHDLLFRSNTNGLKRRGGILPTIWARITSGQVKSDKITSCKNQNFADNMGKDNIRSGYFEKKSDKITNCKMNQNP